MASFLIAYTLTASLIPGNENDLGSKLTFSTNPFHHSLLAPIGTVSSDSYLLDQTYPAKRFYVLVFF